MWVLATSSEDMARDTFRKYTSWDEDEKEEEGMPVSPEAPLTGMNVQINVSEQADM